MRINNSILIIVIAFIYSCTCFKDNENTKKELPELLGKGATIQLLQDESWRSEQQDYTFVITIGDEGLPANDPIGIVNGSYIDRWKFNFSSHWWGQEKPWQTTNENKSNYISATSNRRGVNINLQVGEKGPRKPFVNTPNHFVRSLRERMRYVLEVSADQDLLADDVITIKWENVEAPDYAMHYFFLPFRFSKLPELDRCLPIRTGDFYSLPHIRVKGHSAEYFHVTCQPLLGIDETFSLKIAAIDKYGNLAEDFIGEVKLEKDFPGNFPEFVSFIKDDRGYKTVENLTVKETGWHRIKAGYDNVTGISNYIVVSNEMPSHRIYFGDMHVHTLDCDGSNDILEHFFYAPNVAGLDFGAVTPHAEYFGCKKAWDRYLRKTTKANNPGEFVTFYGYEWAQEGHTNAYFLKAEDAVLIWGEKRMIEKGHPGDSPEFRIGAKDEKEFMEILKKLSQDRPLFTIAHIHSAYKDLDDTIHWLDEMHSIHKRDRKMRENRLRNNLEKGMYLGVVGGSDMHRLTMGHLCKNPGDIWSEGNRGGWDQTAGLQATFATGLTREELYNGMKERHTYGTTGARIVLLFDCNSLPMGSKITFDQNEKPKFNIRVGSTSALSEIALCKYDGEQWIEMIIEDFSNKKSDRYSTSFLDEEFKQSSIYYIRVNQKDGEFAWSSPIWVNSSPTFRVMTGT